MRPDYCPIGGEPCQSVCAAPCSVAKQSKPHEEIISNLLDPRVPKTEREHAAVKEIERLRTLIIRLKKPAAWINFNAATGEQNVSFECESELASIPLWPEPNKIAPTVVRQLVDALQVAVDSDLGVLWLWPESAKETWLKNANAALAAAKEARL